MDTERIDEVRKELDRIATTGAVAVAVLVLIVGSTLAAVLAWAL